VRKIDHGLAKRGAGRISGATVHKRLIDLDLSERQIAQAPQRGKAAAEMVDRNADAVDAKLLAISLPR